MALSSELPQADIRRVVWNSHVYEPSDDSFALVDAVLAWLHQHQQHQHQQHKLPQQSTPALSPPLLADTPPRMCLEVGCGSGFVICSVALALQQLYKLHSCAAASTGQAAGCSFVATDINAAALAATRATLEAHHVAGVELVQTDLVAGLLPQLSGAVDVLLFNPPYVPTPDEEVERDGIARAWAGGHRGRRVTDRLLVQLPELLSPHGHAFIVTVPENKPLEIISMLEGAGLKGVVALTRAADEECLQILHVWRP